MTRFLAGTWKLLRGLPLALLSPILLLLAALLLFVCDVLFLLTPRKKLPQDTAPATGTASVVIPNWNGRDLLEKYLPSVIDALSDSPAKQDDHRRRQRLRRRQQHNFCANTFPKSECWHSNTTGDSAGAQTPGLRRRSMISWSCSTATCVWNAISCSRYWTVSATTKPSLSLARSSLQIPPQAA